MSLTFLVRLGPNEFAGTGIRKPVNMLNLLVVVSLVNVVVPRLRGDSIG
jgi:hypothetical protein